jgi:hypothetical protein
MGLCIRIWDNILVFGTRYIFRVTIAILRLVQNELFQLDISGVNEFFKSFKNEVTGESKNLPPIEDIINESLRVRINNEWLDELKAKYKQLQSPKKTPKIRTVTLKKVREQVMENMEK